MSSPVKHAARLRGGLVGACSALTAAVAHTAAGGMAPASSPLIVLLLLCAALGAAVGGLNTQTRWARTGLLIAGLGAGQFLGHIALAMSDGHHHAASMLTAPMIGLHAAAAVGLGLVMRSGTAAAASLRCGGGLTTIAYDARYHRPAA